MINIITAVRAKYGLELDHAEAEMSRWRKKCDEITAKITALNETIETINNTQKNQQNTSDSKTKVTKKCDTKKDNDNGNS